jgi:hypothetical protein
VCLALPSQTPFTLGVTAATHRRFRGTEWRSIPLPISLHRSRFGTVSCGTHWQALAGLSWLSFSPSVDLLSIAGPVRSGFDCHQSKAPHASQVERSLGLRAPWTGLRSPSEPHPLQIRTALINCHQGLSASPPIVCPPIADLPAGGTKALRAIG